MPGLQLLQHLQPSCTYHVPHRIFGLLSIATPYFNPHRRGLMSHIEKLGLSGSYVCGGKIWGLGWLEDMYDVGMRK
jgi:hypothetical protein